MTDIRDEQGRPIQLTDEFGHPVQLTDEHGVPIHITGVATTVGSDPQDQITIGSELHNKKTHDHATQTTVGEEMHGGTHFAPTPLDYVKHGAGAVAGAGAATVGAVAGAGKAATGAVTGSAAPGSHTQQHVAGDEKKELQRSTSSSSGSSEDDGQGGRRKKKGLMQKIKDKLPGHSDKAAHSPGTTDTDTKVSETKVGTAAGRPVTVEHHEQEHQKKGFLNKIKDKLPGHH
ncbi:putative dehydrin [Helianthus annuus]|uniref:Dehydrin n=1 Tax=Helianthus annuus TaxID=4232 RepID=A0A251TM41_HELAN|nr:probable dehydrin LEA [Helianthus annuus]KAF5787432.1 putative dehydrin [Helianthus annuus]KAJ0880642.1 putative dehydrin [Helianthus annuus]